MRPTPNFRLRPWKEGKVAESSSVPSKKPKVSRIDEMRDRAFENDVETALTSKSCRRRSRSIIENATTQELMSRDTHRLGVDEALG